MSNNLNLYNKAFTGTFGITEAELPGLEYQAIESWDSVGHMGLIAELEDSFGIMMEADDIIEFSSYEKGKEIIAKYGVSVE